jgi:hypothetical protein
MDNSGQLHIAYAQDHNLKYAILTKAGWQLQTVSTNIGGLLNDAALVVDAAGTLSLYFKIALTTL